MATPEVTLGIRSARKRLGLLRARRRADRELLAHVYVPPRLQWRAQELTAPRQRKALARSLRRTIGDADPRYLPGASPLNRRAVRLNATRLDEVARRLDDVDRSVGARGVLLVDQLLTDGSGPLYDIGGGEELRDAVDAILAELEAHT